MKKNINMVKVYRNSKFGRAVARLFGEETGAVMMEYVVVAVVIAAACALIMAIWGRSIFQEAQVATNSVVNKPTEAETAQGTAQGDAVDGIMQAQQSQNAIAGSEGRSEAH